MFKKKSEESTAIWGKMECSFTKTDESTTFYCNQCIDSGFIAEGPRPIVRESLYIK